MRSRPRSGRDNGPPDGSTQLLGIVGSPLTHSLSPRLHTEVLRRLGRNLLYVPLPVPEDRLEDLIALAPSLGLVGINVTTPFKEAVARLVTPFDRETARTGVVNTVRFGKSGAEGCGTDGAGILDSLERWGLCDEPFGVLGFGATARSLVHRAWRDRRPIRAVVSRQVTVQQELDRWLRASVRDRRERLTARRLPEVWSWSAVMKDDLELPRVWVSTLPPQAAGEMTTQSWLRRLPKDSFVLDLNYGKNRDRLANASRARRLETADGRTPLMAQAARSLSFWLREPVDIALFNSVM